MKRLRREYDKIETVNLFAMLPSPQELAITDPSRKEAFHEWVDAGLARALQSESTLHGIRVQTMFQSMVAGFDKVVLIKQDDAGECYYNCDEEIRPPDFRVVQSDGTSLLVETKNHYKTDPATPFSIRKADLGALSRYSSLFHTPLKLAIYWARWNTWTLNDPNVFKWGGDRGTVDLMEALSTSEMSRLGDVMVGTEYPLVLRIRAVEDRPRSISPEGKVEFHMGGFEIYSGDHLVDDELERAIAFYLISYGKWQDDGPGAELDPDGLPTAILYRFKPEETHPGQGFEIIGSLSSLFSAFYNSVTLEQSRVSNLIHYDDPSRLAPIIPPNYKGKALRLWQFVQEP